MAELIFDVQLQERLAVSVMLAAASSPASILFQSNFVHPSQSSPDRSSDMQSIDCMCELTCMKFSVLCIAVEWWGNIYSYFPQGYDFSLMLPVLSEGFSTPHLWQVKDEEKSWVEFSLSE